MRVAIGGFVHEGNSFSVETINLQKFEEFIYTKPEELVDRHRHDKRIMGGFIDYAEEKGWDILPLVTAFAIPAGPIEKETYEIIKSQLCDPLKKQEVDGILLHLHGAIVSEEVSDCEGDILKTIREAVGTEIPIMTVHDLHANISPDMITTVNGLFGYNTQPHSDQYEREYEAAALLDKMVQGEVKPYCTYEQPPALLPAISTDTSIGAMKPIMERAYEYENEEGIINVSPFAGFYGSDTKNAGASVVVVAEDSCRKRAEEIAAEMAEYFWDKKDSFFVQTVPVKEALELSGRTNGICAFIDEADDPMGGGPADGTYILEQLIQQGAASAAVMTIYDSEFTDLAFQAGEGNIVKGKLGGKTDQRHGDPIEITGNVIKLYEGKIPLSCWNEADLQNPGRIAVVDYKGIHIVITANKTCTEMINIFQYLDMDVTQYKILVGKGLGESYRMVYKDLVKEFLTIDSIGVTNPDITKLGEFKQIRRPIYPLDKNVAYKGRA